MREYKYLIPITGLFTATLLISNTLAGKIFLLGPPTLSAGIIVFPLAYLFGDILTEVYGYAASRKVIWSGFAALALMSLCYALPVTLLVVKKLKKIEHEDYFDTDTNFNPFTLKVTTNV